jgi:hypothetical protein
MKQRHFIHLFPREKLLPVFIGNYCEDTVDTRTVRSFVIKWRDADGD